jgi:hypothetical protein
MSEWVNDCCLMPKWLTFQLPVYHGKNKCYWWDDDDDDDDDVRFVLDQHI